MADVSEIMWTRRARESSSYIGSVILISCCSYILFNKLKRRKKQILIFSRYPEAGKAKTRLIPSLGQSGAAQVQVCMTEHILKAMRRYEVSNKDVDITLQYTGGTHKLMKFWLDKKTRGMNCFYRPQRGNDLGEKLHLAISDSFNRGHESVVVIGGDIPGINEDIVETAFKLLNNKLTDMVLGKAEDGGYYLVGLNKSTSSFLDKIFDNIDWGTSQVFKQQLDQAISVGATPEILPVILADVVRKLSHNLRKRVFQVSDQDTLEDIAVFEREVGIPVDQLKTVKWSIIIPVLNEEKNISDTLHSIIKSCNDIDNIQEIIISDGGSRDNTVEVVKTISQSFPVPLNVIASKPGRGIQLIHGADLSTGDYLLFLHADTKVPQDFDTMAARCIQTPGVVCGAFEFQFDVIADDKLRSKEGFWFLLQMYLLVWGTRRRSRKKEFPYGDQGLFMSKRTYKEVGGFPAYYLMEDYILVDKLRTIGHVAIADGDPIITSHRRWKKWGYIRVSVYRTIGPLVLEALRFFNECVDSFPKQYFETKITGLNQLIIWAYKLGVHPNTLAEWYYGKKIK